MDISDLPRQPLGMFASTPASQMFRLENGTHTLALRRKAKLDRISPRGGDNDGS